MLRSRSVELALTVAGAHLAPVTFFPERGERIQPYAIAPWAEESLPPDLPPLLASLRGDWSCSAFGANEVPSVGRKLPLHGETANNLWREVARGDSSAGCWLQLATDIPLQGGSCESITTLLHDHTIVYQRHDLKGLTGPINPGHHATLAFPDTAGMARLSFSRHLYAHTFLEPTERPENLGYSWLKPNVEMTDLHAVPCIDGSTTDLCRFPARRGFDDTAIICADPELPFAWSAATFPVQGYVWFALRNPKQLASTLMWSSNGGRHFPPWNGRHTNVLAMEDITGFFQIGLEASRCPNLLSRKGIRTYLEPDAHGRLSIPYIQGVSRIPTDFDELASIEPRPSGLSMLLVAKSGVPADVRCQTNFLSTGTLSGIAT